MLWNMHVGDQKMSKGERSFATRNRRGEPATTLMDEFIDGKPTGKVVSGYQVAEGSTRVEPRYVDLRANSAAVTSRVIEQLRDALPLDAGYIGVQRGFEYQAAPEEVAQVIRASKPVRNPNSRDTVLTPVIVAPHRERVVIQQHEDLVPVYVLEFDGPSGIERKEFASAKLAREYPAFLTSYYSTTLFSNFRLFREYRAPREEISLELN
jgi:hypothetical protein